MLYCHFCDAKNLKTWYSTSSSVGLIVECYSCHHYGTPSKVEWKGEGYVQIIDCTEYNPVVFH